MKRPGHQGNADAEGTPENQVKNHGRRLLIALVQDAVENKFANAIRNRITGQLPADIRIIKNHLFDKCGKIHESELQIKYNETIKLIYNISDPIDDIFNAVGDLCEIE